MKRLAGSVLVVLVGSSATMFGFVGVGNAAKPPSTQASFVDFAQCANGAAPSSSTGCPAGWINGILNTSNSHYGEDTVVPQRLELELDPGSAAAGRTVTLRYQARKGTFHAYDSLATWNLTQSAAVRCDGLASCVGGSSSTYAIPDDTTPVPPATLNGAETSGHMVPVGSGRLMTMYGGTITDVSVPVHDNASGTGDDWAEVTVTYAVADTAVARRVQLLFGGHIAAGLGSRGWGAGLGASGIAGGPYHVKLEAVDGSSIGNRDNQIQGSAIGFPTISTIPVPAATTVGAPIHDTATVSGDSSPTGTVTFSLYPPGDPTCSGSPVFGDTAALSGGTAASAAYTTLEVGTYRWVAIYNGDSGNAPAVSGCDEELVTVSAPVTPDPEVTPTPDPEITPTPDPEVTPTPDPEVTPTPDPEITPTPDPEITPTPDPEVTPTPDPEVTPTPDPEVTPTPDPEVTPTPDPEVTPTPDPEVTPDLETTPTTDVTPVLETSSTSTPRVLDVRKTLVGPVVDPRTLARTGVGIGPLAVFGGSFLLAGMAMTLVPARKRTGGEE